jgi:hypothetical protein
MMPTEKPALTEEQLCLYENCRRRWTISQSTLGGRGFCSDHAWVILNDRPKDLAARSVIHGGASLKDLIRSVEPLKTPDFKTEPA